MKKKLLIVLVGVGALVVTGTLLVVLLVDVNAYRSVIESRLGSQLGREVTLGEMSLGLVPPRFEVARTSIAEAPGFGSQPNFVSTDRLAVRVGLLHLIFGNVDIRSIELERPVVELVRNEAGVWNFSTLGNPDSTLDDTSPSATEAAPEFVLGRLSIVDGQIAITDIGEGSRTVYDHVDVTLRDYARGQPFSLDVAVHLPGEGAQLLHLAGTAGPINADRMLETPFDGTLTLDEVGAEGLRSFLNTDLLRNSNGSLSGTTRLVNEGDRIDATGNLVFDDVLVNGVAVGYPIELDYDGEARLDTGLYSSDRAMLLLGNTPLSVAGSVNTQSDPATIDLDVGASDVPIEEVARLGSALGVAFPPETQVAGTLDMDVQARGSAQDPALNGTISGQNLVISGTRVRQPVEIDRLDLELTPTEVHSNEFEIRSGTTSAMASFNLSDYASEVPGIDARIQAPGATLPDIQSIASAYGFTGLEQIEGEGSLDVDLRASGPLDSDADSQDMMRALNGAINLDFSPLTILGVDAARELGTIGGFDVASGASNLTELVRLSGVITIADGIARTDDLQAQLAIGNVAAAGTADLAARTLDLDLSAVLSAAFTESVGGTGIASYLNTVLANREGELILPVRVTGTFDNPQFSPDTQAFTEMQAERLLPTLDDPSGLLNRLTGGGNPDGEQEGEATPDSSETEEVIRGVLGGIFGGKQ